LNNYTNSGKSLAYLVSCSIPEGNSVSWSSVSFRKFYSFCFRHKNWTPLFLFATIAYFAEPNVRKISPEATGMTNPFFAVKLQIGYWKGLYANVTSFCGILGSKVGEIHDKFSDIHSKVYIPQILLFFFLVSK
jgi:hypothetical protein